MTTLRSFLVPTILLLSTFAVPVHAQNPAPAVGSAAVVQPGDVVRVAVWRNDALSGEFIVGDDGTLMHPLYRGIRVKGMSLADVEQEVRKVVGEFEESPRLSVELRFRVGVGGEVRNPNLLTLDPSTTLIQAISLAGGPSDRANLKKVQIVRDGMQHVVDLTQPDIMRMAVRSGDQLVVTRRSDLLRDYVGPLAGVASTIATIVVIILQQSQQ